MALVSTEKKSRFWTWCAILAGFLIILPSSIPSYYGNLSSYTNSYFLALHSNYRPDDLHSEWIVSIFLMCECPCTLLADFIMSKVIGRMKCLLISMLVFDVGVALTYWTIGHSLVGTFATLGVLTGLSTGTMMSLAYKLAVEWSPENTGLATAIVSCGFGGGTLIFNSLITSHVNPENKELDMEMDQEKFFTQRSILKKIPSVFLLIAFTSFVIHVIGFVLIKIIQCKAEESDDCKTLLDKAKPYENNNIIITKSEQSGESGESEESEESQCIINIETSIISKHPLQVLRDPQFYVTFAMFSALVFCYVSITNYYKRFGQLFISDDQFLATIGSLTPFGVILTRLLSGYFIDAFGIKNTMIMSLALNTILLSFFYWIPSVSGWLYMVWVSLAFGIQSAFYCVMPLISLKFFGPKFCITNTGLLFISVVVTGFIAPETFAIVLSKFSWHAVFNLGSGVSTFALILVILFMKTPK